jgi:hypothetical protein
MTRDSHRHDDLPPQVWSQTESALRTEEFFGQRAGNSQAGALARLLSQVQDREPCAGDEMPPSPKAEAEYTQRGSL